MRKSTFGLLIVLLTIILSAAASAQTQTGSGSPPGSVAQGAGELSPADGAGKTVGILGIDQSAFPKVKVNVLINKTCALKGGLAKENFKVAEEGGSVPIDDFYFTGNASGQKLDLAIVFDDTGSMGPQIDAMKAKARDLTSSIKAAGIDANYSLVSFKDSVTVRTNWTADPDVFKRQISSLQASGGNDEPEASLDAIEAVLSQGFRPDAQKVILVITDAHAHYKDDGSSFSKYTKEEVERDLRDSGAIFVPVSPTFTTKSSYVDLRDIANALQSQWIDINSADFSTILEQFKEMITGSYVIGYTSPNEAAPQKRTVIVSVDAPGCVAGNDSSSYFTGALENLPPIINDLSAVQGKAKEITWTTNATDSDNDKILYRYFLNNKSMTEWNDSNKWTLNATEAEAGKNQVEVQIRDGKHKGPEGYDDAKSVQFTLSSMKLMVQTWETILGGWTTEANSVQQTSDGGYIVAGKFENSSCLIKIDASGNKLWEKAFEGANVSDSGQQTEDGGYIIAGSQGGYAWLIKTDSDGNKLWMKTFDSIASCLKGILDTGYHVQQTTDGGYVLAGWTSSLDGNFVWWLAKTDSDGNILWDKTFTFGKSDFEYARSVQETDDRGFILSGFSPTSSKGYYCTCLIKTDSKGNKEWDRAFPGIGGGSVHQTSDGGYIVSGGQASHLIKTDSFGNIEWDKFSGTNTVGELDNAEVIQTNDGGYITTNTIWNKNPTSIKDLKMEGWKDLEMEGWELIKINSVGDPEWTKKFPMPYADLNSIIQAKDGGFVLAGDGPSYGAYIIKTDASGNV